MAKYSMSKQKSSRAKGRLGCEISTPKLKSSFTDRDLCKVSPLREQFEPTDAEPVSQRKRMAGG